MVKACGAVTIVPLKTRLVFMVRTRFAGVYPRKSYLRAGFRRRAERLRSPGSRGPSTVRLNRHLGPFV